MKTQNIGKQNGKKSKGFALPIVIILSFISAVVTSSFLYQADVSSQGSGEILRRREAFYAVDGMSRIIIREVQNYMMLNPDPTTEDLQDADNIAVPEVPGYDVESFVIESTGDAYDAPIPNGPFETMYAHQKPILMSILGRRTGGVEAGEVHLRVILGQISLFQFLVWGQGYTDMFPGPNMTANPGRIHSNGDLCIGSNNQFKIETVTSAGKIIAGDSSRCRRIDGPGAYIFSKIIGDYVYMNSSNSNGCTDCPTSGVASGLKWSAYAKSVWGGNVMDSAHGVPTLRLPIAGTPSTQAGLNASAIQVSNAASCRLLVDPVRADDTDDVVVQKFAYKADLRIINGVWYKNDGTWPGIPIWSDHPGRFETKNAEGIEGEEQQDVGQQDLEELYEWPSVPHRYSFYEYDDTNYRLYSDTTGVISYGNLYRTATPTWKPGYFAAGANNNTFTDIDAKTKKDFCDKCGNSSTCAGSRSLRDATVGYCQQLSGTTYSYLIDAQLLQATRGGFIDYRIRNVDTAKAPMLPINFDLAQFAAAMADTTEGELGFHFNGGADFNGIVYISSTWSGAMTGMTSEGSPEGIATLWPSLGAVSDASQVVTYNTAMVQRALPFPLCSDNLGYSGGTRTAFSGPPSDNNSSNGFEPNFTVPPCYSSTYVTSRPNSVRVINGTSISDTTFPKGLSLVSNLPVYVLGSLNTSSVTTNGDSEPWIPVMIGGDAIMLLSNSWIDSNAPWDNTGSYTSRVASDTTYNMEFLGGMVETTDSSHYSGGIENYPRFLEKWSSKSATIKGSFVVSHHSVYHRFKWRFGSPVYEPPTRNWFFDEHLRIMENQPPGAPLFSVHSVSRLNRM